MNRKTLQAFCIVSAATVATASFVTSSQARTTMASAGRAVASADYGCFVLDSSSMANICTNTTSLETSLVIDAGGSFTVTVNAEGATPSNTVGCQAWGVDKTARFFSISGAFKFLSIFGSPQDITLNPVSVPTRGGMFVSCQVSHFGRVNTFNW
jgi:hypothetical protein